MHEIRHCRQTGGNMFGNTFRLKCSLGSALLCLPVTATAASLSDYQWHHRVLVVAAPEITDPAVAQVRRHLQLQSVEFADRDLLVMQLFARGESRVEDRPIATRQAEQLRERLEIGADEKLLILIGKDGSVKRRAPLQTDLGEILDQIDTMPMRRDEIIESNESDRYPSTTGTGM
jgi:hypothetical protein